MLHRKNKRKSETLRGDKGTLLEEDLFSVEPRRKTRSEAVREGIRRHQAEGKPWGRQRIFDYEEIRRLWLKGLSIKEIKQLIGCQKDTVMKAVGEIGRSLVVSEE